MQAITDYQIKDSYLRLLLQGQPGSGKSTAAAMFPGAYFIDLDVNLGGPLRFLKKRNLQLPLGYDRIDIDETGKPVPQGARFARLDKCLVTAQSLPEVKTIIIDSATTLADLMFQETERKNPGVKDGRQIFGFFLNDSKRLIATLTAMRKNLVLIAHEKVEKDEMSQILQYKLSWPGQLGDYMGAFFTNVWRCEIEKSGFGATEKYTRKIRTIQDSQFFGLKNDMELPSRMEFDWKVIEAQFNS